MLVSQSMSVKDSLGHKTSSHTTQHPLVDVQAYSGPSKSQSDQGLSCFLIILLSALFQFIITRRHFLSVLYAPLVIVGTICYSVIVLQDK